MAIYRRARSTRFLVATLVVASLIVITVDFRGGEAGPLEQAGKAVFAIVSPLQAAVSRVFRPVGNFFTGLFHVGSLASENRDLKQRIQELEQQASQNVSTRRLIERMEAILKLQQTLGLQGFAATVTAESLSNFEWSVTIDKGSGDGVRMNMPVVSGEGLVGHVVFVTGNWSKVQLIIDPQSAVAARLASSGETGLVSGQRDQDLKMELVSPDAQVFPNEEVDTSGFQGGLYPPGIVVGFVSHVFQEPGTLNKTVGVRPAVDFSSLEIVFVVTGQKRPEPTPSPKRTRGSPKASPPK